MIIEVSMRATYEYERIKNTVFGDRTTDCNLKVIVEGGRS